MRRIFPFVLGGHGWGVVLVELDVCLAMGLGLAGVLLLVRLLLFCAGVGMPQRTTAVAGPVPCLLGRACPWIERGLGRWGWGAGCSA